MQLAEISIRRPVLATVLSLLVLLIGAVSFNRLSVREYPRIDEPVVTVSVRYGGASAEVMEAQVTKPLEDSIAGIDAVDVITSLSRAEQSQISVRFRLEKDADNAAAEVRDRTSRVRNRLPDGVDEPVIAKVEADAVPVMWLAFSSDTLSPLQINDLLVRIVKPRLQTVSGVADVPIYGERRYAMRVWLDPQRMAGYRLTTQDIEDAIRRNNLELPAGRIESQQREFSVTSQTDLLRPAQFGDITIKGEGTETSPYVVPWDALIRAEEQFDPSRNSLRIPEFVAILHDKWVRLDGYVSFPLMTNQPKELLAMLNMWDGCCIGVPPTPYDAVEVHLKKAITGDERFSVSGRVTGRFSVKPYVVKSWLVGMYVMEDADFAPSEDGEGT